MRQKRQRRQFLCRQRPPSVMSATADQATALPLALATFAHKAGAASPSACALNIANPSPTSTPRAASPLESALALCPSDRQTDHLLPPSTSSTPAAGLESGQLGGARICCRYQTACFVPIRLLSNLLAAFRFQVACSQLAPEGSRFSGTKQFRTHWHRCRRLLPARGLPTCVARPA